MRGAAPAGVIDTHVHVFPKGAPLAKERRYTPASEALPGVCAR